MEKLTKLQKTKFDLIRKYLDSETGKEYALSLADNESTSIHSVKKLYMNATGIYLKGNTYPLWKTETDRLYDGTEITKVYRAAMKADEDFQLFVNNETKDLL
ncbi:MAG: hypothetical protein ABUK08_00425 [Candidatus Humimicrobiaceae bacterium]